MITPKKHLGQNFLRDPNTARKIVAALGAGDGDAVVEIGPGTGALTGLLHERFPGMVAIEVDARAVRWLEAQHTGLDVRRGDVLATDWSALGRQMGGPLYVIGNLPYNITSPILFSLLDAHDAIAEAVVMMQREVAERIVAAPGNKAYGILSVVLQHHTEAALLFRVSPHVFFPKPAVQSAVLRLVFRKADHLFGTVTPDFFRQVVRTAFNQRRKTLRNSLRALCAVRGVTLPERWAALRPEALHPQDFLDLAHDLAERSSTGTNP